MIWVMPHSRIVSRDSPWESLPPSFKATGAQKATAVGCIGRGAALARLAAATTRTAPGRDPRAADRVTEA